MLSYLLCSCISLLSLIFFSCDICSLLSCWFIYFPIYSSFAAYFFYYTVPSFPSCSIGFFFPLSLSLFLTGKCWFLARTNSTRSDVYILVCLGFVSVPNSLENSVVGRLPLSSRIVPNGRDWLRRGQFCSSVRVRCQIILIFVRLLRGLPFLRVPILCLPVYNYEKFLEIVRRLRMYSPKAHRLCYILQTFQDFAWIKLWFKWFLRTRQTS